MELRCWGADWGLPSVHTDSLVVLVRLSPRQSDCSRPLQGCASEACFSPRFFLCLLHCHFLVSPHANSAACRYQLLGRKARSKLTLVSPLQSGPCSLQGLTFMNDCMTLVFLPVTEEGSFKVSLLFRLFFKLLFY